MIVWDRRLKERGKGMGGLYARFCQVAEENSDKIAVLAEGENTSYSKLLAMSLQIAGFLKHKCSSDCPVALFHDKSSKSYAFMLAAISQGIPYSCIDIKNPPVRLESIFSTLSNKFVVGPEAWREEFNRKEIYSKVEFLSIEEICGGPTFQISTPALEENSVAYIMFTSGSTGSPKGVTISHKNVMRFIDWILTDFSLGPEKRLLNVNPMYFDNSVFDFFGAFFTGAALIPVDFDLLHDFKRLQLIILEKKPTFWFSVPSTLIYLQRMKVLNEKVFESFEYVMFGGEGFHETELKKLDQILPKGCEMVNVYGPTECTCICSAKFVDRSNLEALKGLPSLGKLLPGFDGKIVSEGGEERAVGEVGELVLFGPNVGIGYLNDSRKTEISFINVNSDDPYKRGYKTGDLVRLDPSSLEYSFIGRSDNQIKHMGYRIELEEIELALCLCASIIEAAVIYKKNPTRAGEIIGFVSTEDEEDLSLIREQIENILPSYMLPHRFIWKHELPKNSNGKIDKKKLREEIKG